MTSLASISTPYQPNQSVYSPSGVQFGRNLPYTEATLKMASTAARETSQAQPASPLASTDAAQASQLSKLLQQVEQAPQLIGQRLNALA